MQNSIEVRLLFSADPIAAHFAMSDGFQVHLVDQIVDRQLLRKVGLVPKNQQWDPVKRLFVHQLVQLLFGYG